MEHLGNLSILRNLKRVTGTSIYNELLKLISERPEQKETVEEKKGVIACQKWSSLGQNKKYEDVLSSRPTNEYVFSPRPKKLDKFLQTKKFLFNKVGGDPPKIVEYVY